VLLGDSPMFDLSRCFEALADGRTQRAASIASESWVEWGRVVLPAALVGWLSQCAAPGRPRRVPDQAADYADGMPLRPAA
jgi:hypothetical protein